MTTARLVAYELLAAVDDHDAYANLVLPTLLEQARLSGRDAGFATELGYGTLRLRGWYDAVIAQVVSRPLAQLDPPVLRVLRLGAHQLLTMQLPAHAAVAESVTLAKQVGARSASGLVNAALRRISERTPQQWQQRATAGLAGHAALAVRFSHPEWIVDALAESLTAAGHPGELEQLLAADNENPAVNYVSLPGVGPAPDTLGEPNRFSPLGARSAGGDPRRVTGQSGVRVQDEGSQLAALALGRARAIEPGERWLDVCAGPGGKAVLLAAEARAGGAEFVANEVSAHRAQLVRNTLAPLGWAVPVTELDGRMIAKEGGRYERILLDAPCSGLGALRRRPEARWRKQPDDVPELAELQRELLTAALTALTPGGLLAYVTCSPHLAETADVVAAVVADTGAQILDTASILDRIALEPLDASVPLAGGTVVQLWPHRHHTDAMFIALLSAANPLSATAPTFCQVSLDQE